MKEKLKEQNGITLIALVITIIVLLILAGVTISVLTGDNGIITKAQSAKKTSDDASEKEQIQLAVASSKINESATVDKETLKTSLEDISDLIESGIPTSTDYTFPLTITGKSGTTYTINEDSTVDPLVIQEGCVTAQQIAANPSAYYGKVVKNYKASDDDTNTYRIFYVDADNYFGDGAYSIYLKADPSEETYEYTSIETPEGELPNIVNLNPSYDVYLTVFELITTDGWEGYALVAEGLDSSKEIVLEPRNLCGRF